MSSDIHDCKEEIEANWICPDCCWFDGETKCLCSPDHNGDEESCWGVCACADFAEIKTH